MRGGGREIFRAGSSREVLQVGEREKEGGGEGEECERPTRVEDGKSSEDEVV